MSNRRQQPFWLRFPWRSQPTPQRIRRRLPSRPSHDQRPTSPPERLEPEPQPKPPSPPSPSFAEVESHLGPSAKPPSPTSSPRRAVRTPPPSPERSRDSHDASQLVTSPTPPPSPSRVKTPSHVKVPSQLASPTSSPRRVARTPAPSPERGRDSPPVSTPALQPSPSHPAEPSKQLPTPIHVETPSQSELSEPEISTKLGLSTKTAKPTPSPSRVARKQTPSPPPSSLRTVARQPSRSGLKTKTPIVLPSGSPSPLLTTPSSPSQVVVSEVESHPTEVETHHPQTTKPKQSEEETEPKLLGEESKQSLETKDATKLPPFGPLEDKTKEAIEQKIAQVDIKREKTEESSPKEIKDERAPVKPQTSEDEMLELHVVEQKRDGDELTVPEKVHIKETRRSAIDIDKDKGTNIAVSAGPEHSFAQDKRSLHMEIKDGLSKLVQKLNIGHQQKHGNAVTFITLAGENRGATLVLGSESIDKEEFARVRGEQQQRKEDIRKIRDPKEIEGHGKQSILANVNCNVQSINNSLMQESSFNDKDPGVHLVFSGRETEPSESKAETFKTTASTTPAQNVAYDPNIRRRCLRGLFLDSEDDKDPQKPRRHGCRFSCDEKKGKAEQDKS